MGLSDLPRSLRGASLLLLLLAVGAWWRLKPETAGADANGTGAANADVSEAVSRAFSTDVPQPVTGVPVRRDTLWISVNAAGRAETPRRAALQAQVGGVVEAVLVRENAAVQPGDVLIRLDTADHALAVARAESDLRRARADFEQLVLFDDRIEDAAVRAQREGIARARSGLDQAEVALRQATLALDRTRVTAPFAGRVADLGVAAGQSVAPGAALVTVVDLDPVEVQVNVLEAELDLLREGNRATVRFAAFPGQTFAGRIATVNPVVDPGTRTGRVTVGLANPGGRIKPGMYAEVALAATSFADRLLVPRAAILERGEGTRRTMLFVYEEGAGGARAKWRYVTTGRANETLVEIVPSDEGTVAPGETVLVDGHHYLAHDTPVRLVDDVADAGGRPGG